MMRWMLRIDLKSETEYQNVYARLKQMLQIVAVQMPGWIFLYRYDAAIASEDLSRQIRQVGCGQDSINFVDTHSSTTQVVSVEEWKQFAQLIEIEINRHSRVPCQVWLMSDLTQPCF